MVAPTCFGITLPYSGNVPSAFWQMPDWVAVDRILWMSVLCLVTWCANYQLYCAFPVYGCVHCFQLRIFKIHIRYQGSPGKVFSVVTRLQAGGTEFESRQGQNIFSVLKNRQYWLWVPASFLFSGYLCSFRGVNRLGPDVDSPLYLALRMRVSGNSPSIHQCTHVWRYGPFWALATLRILLYPTLVSTNFVFAFVLARLSSIWNCTSPVPICLRGQGNLYL
jgi:hypothetical protein